MNEVLAEGSVVVVAVKVEREGDLSVFFERISGERGEVDIARAASIEVVDLCWVGRSLEALSAANSPNGVKTIDFLGGIL